MTDHLENHVITTSTAAEWCRQPHAHPDTEHPRPHARGRTTINILGSSEVIYSFVLLREVHQCLSLSLTNTPGSQEVCGNSRRIFCVISFMESVRPECHTHVTEFRAFSIKNCTVGVRDGVTKLVNMLAFKNCWGT